MTEKNCTIEPQARFLDKSEYGRTWEVFTEAFGTEEEAFLREFYGEMQPDGTCTGTINHSVIAAIEEDGKIVSSAQVMLAVISPEGSRAGCEIPYIMGVCTLQGYRHRGYMDRVLQLLLDRIRRDGYPWCFLVPVDTAIYRHLGFVHDWQVTESELRHIYADGEGLEIASAKVFQENAFVPGRVIGARAYDMPAERLSGEC